MWQEWSWLLEDRNPCPGFWDHVLDTWISSSLQSQSLLPHGFCRLVLMSRRNCLSLEKSPHPCSTFDPHLSPPDPQYKHFFQTKPFWRSEGHRDSNCSCSPRIFFLSAVFVQRSFPMTTWPRAPNIQNQTPHDGSAKNQLPFIGPTLEAESRVSLRCSGSPWELIWVSIWAAWTKGWLRMGRAQVLTKILLYQLLIHL